MHRAMFKRLRGDKKLRETIFLLSRKEKMIALTGSLKRFPSRIGAAL